MNENSLSINPAAAMAAGGVVGLGTGYVFAPRKYSLKRLLVQQPDTFERLFPKDVKETMVKSEQISLNSIQKASGEFHASGIPNQATVKDAAKKWRRKFTMLQINTDLLEDAAAKKKALQEAIEKGSSLRAPSSEYKKALKAVRKARFEAMRALPDKGLDVKTAFREMKEALARKHTTTSNKLFELTNSDSLRASYKAIKKFLPKARARSAAAGAVTLGTLTTLVSIFFNPSTQNN